MTNVASPREISARAADPVSRTTSTERGLGIAFAAVLLVDACFHLCWSTGAGWPAADEYSLSLAVLGFGVDFRPGTLIPLALLLGAGAGVVLARALLGRRHRFGALWQAGAAVVTAGVLLRGLLGLVWAVPATGHVPGAFYWTNVLVYTPLCLALAAAGLRLLRPAERRRPVDRAAALGMPVVLVAALLFGSYGLAPGAEDGYPPDRQLVGTASRYVDTPLARFHFVREGQGPPVVLLSPGASWVAAWMPEIRALSATHTVYAVDLPGQGFTRLHDRDFVFDLDGMTTAVGTFLDAVHVDRAALAGNSWSGGWALAFAQRHPERVSRLLLLAPSGLHRPDPLGWELLKLPLVGRTLAQLGAMSRATQESALRDLFVHQDALTPGLVESFYATNTFPDNVRSMYELEAGLDWAPVERALPVIRQPTLVLWGRQDTVLPVDDAAVFGARLPDATVHVLDGCGHALTLDCPEPVSALMEGFLGDQ
ncbi:MAG: alpha/beta fold hydrolase [Actinophytocola sp.]|uniref:alpha/beta fold hydrolase n=1 Tax=Actinophytocola sp. TaxID=1872138 RepID=UPI001326522D|nr:alpha/beta fold hydrolase [Actinophytocola sp.]MPZ83478.1 alpha/beta fold hydrolase [Actinophytocola sp.]